MDFQPLKGPPRPDTFGEWYVRYQEQKQKMSEQDASPAFTVVPTAPKSLAELEQQRDALIEQLTEVQKKIQEQKKRNEFQFMGLAK